MKQDEIEYLTCVYSWKMHLVYEFIRLALLDDNNIWDCADGSSLMEEDLYGDDFVPEILRSLYDAVREDKIFEIG